MQDTFHHETSLSYHLYQHVSGTALLNPWQCNSSNEGTHCFCQEKDIRRKQKTEGKKSRLEAFIILFSWVLYYPPPLLKWFWNSHKHIEKIGAYKTPCPRGTKQNWVRKLGNIWLAQANTIRQKNEVLIGMWPCWPKAVISYTDFSTDALSNSGVTYHILKRTCLVSSSTLHIHSVLSPPSSKEEKPFITFFWA